MAALTALGVERAADSFPGPLSAEAIDAITLAPNLRKSFADYLEFWDVLRTRLESVGRHDLSQAVSRKLRKARRHQAWLEERDWKGWLRRADRRLLGGRLTRMTRAIRRPAS